MAAGSSFSVEDVGCSFDIIIEGLIPALTIFL